MIGCSEPAVKLLSLTNTFVRGGNETQGITYCYGLEHANNLCLENTSRYTVDLYVLYAVVVFHEFVYVYCVIG